MFEGVLYWNKPNHSIVNRFRFWDKKLINGFIVDLRLILLMKNKFGKL